MNVERDEEPKVGRETQDGGVVSGADGHLCSARERSVVSAPSLPPWIPMEIDGRRKSENRGGRRRLGWRRTNLKAMNGRESRSTSAVLTTHVWSVVKQNKQAGREGAGVFIL